MLKRRQELILGTDSLSPPLSLLYQEMLLLRWGTLLSDKQDALISKFKTISFFDHIIYLIIKLWSQQCENRSLIKRGAFDSKDYLGSRPFKEKESKSWVPTVLLILNFTKRVSTWSSEQAETTFRDMCHGWLHRSPQCRVAIHTKWECCSVMPVLLIQLLISSWLGALIADVTNHK